MGGGHAALPAPCNNAPAALNTWLPDRLHIEADTVWEVMHRSYTNNLRELSHEIGCIGALAPTANSLHIHLSFHAPSVRARLKEIVAMAVFLNDHMLTGVLASHNGGNWDARAWASYAPQAHVDTVMNNQINDGYIASEYMSGGHNWGPMKNAAIAFRHLYPGARVLPALCARLCSACCLLACMPLRTDRRQRTDPTKTYARPCVCEQGTSWGSSSALASTCTPWTCSCATSSSTPSATG